MTAAGHATMRRILTPTGDLTWMDRAACATRPYNGFTEAPIDQQQAVCGRCPVSPECALYALDTHSKAELAERPAGISYGGVIV